MRARLQKWGNSLAVRVPKAFAVEAGLAENALVDVSLVEGRLIVVPVAEPVVTLEALLARVTDETLHREVDTGPMVGNELG